jgi:NAD(P)-dependent dehydrogenase (short-subunit alcohol dehydrogenase family)
MRHFILITGASTGIGEAACEKLVEHNYEVLAGVRSKVDADRLRVLYGEKVQPLIMDVTNAQEMKEARETAEKIIGNDCLVAIINNAGIAIPGAVLYIPIEEWQRQLEINVLGVVRTTQLFFHLLPQKSGNIDSHPRRIINISSVSGLFASPFIGAYAASKFALEALSDSLRRELYMYDIQVVIIEPGNILTPMWTKAKESIPHLGPEYDSIIAFRDKVVDSNISQGLDVELVSTLILKAIRNKKVKNRYLIRYQAWKFRLIQLLPTSWVDAMIRKKLKSRSGIRPF